MKKKILVVDDTPDLLQSLEELLLMEGYKVYVATNGVEGLKVLSTVTPDLIISDLLMPEMDGEKMISELRRDKKTKNIPVLVFSASPYDKEKLANNMGAGDFLLKPSTPDIILEVVERLLSQ
ncbi:hypothetical protein WSM22_36680 [Cytophagales bacterium WSM2-2]|nr:hypothetical protein WSM22_36680 [Cytophagales bacterium WSM2-2]